MALNIGTTSPDHGDIRDGWSQIEEASPHVVGDMGGQARETSFSAQANATSDLLLGEQIAVDGPFDSAGNVLGVTLSGAVVSASSYDVDSKFLPAKDFPPVASGFDEAALDMVQRYYGQGVVTLPWAGRGICHAYYPMRGYNQGFTVDGLNQPYFQGDWGDTVTTANATQSYFYGPGACPGNLWVRLPQGVYCRQAQPLINPLLSGTNVNYMAYRVRLAASTTISTRLNWQWSGSALSPDLFLRISRTTGTAGTIGIDGSYRQFNDTVTTAVTTTTVPTTGLDMSKEIGFVMQWGFLTAADNATLRVKIYAFDPQSPPGGAPSVVISMDLTNAMRAAFVGNNSLISRTTGASPTQFGFRDVIISQTDSSWPVHYPVIPEPALIGNDFTKDNLGVGSVAPAMSVRNPIPAWSGSGFEYLKMLTSARARQMQVESGVLMFHDLNMSNVYPVGNTVDTPVRQLNAGNRARTVDVVARTATTETSMFGAVNYRDTTSWTFRQNEEFDYRIDLPPGEHQKGKILVSVVDSEETPISPTELWNRGARFDTYADAAGNVHMQVRGPRTVSAALGVGPWKIVALEVINVGFFETPETLTLITGAADSMVTREKGGTVDNPFLNSYADVFDRGMWAASDYGDPVDELSFTVPESERPQYYPGRVIGYANANYRVKSVTHARGGTQVKAAEFTTVAQHDAVWPSTTASVVDSYFSAAGFRCIDGAVHPLKSSLVNVAPLGFEQKYPSKRRATS